MKILYIKNGDTSFIRLDEEILVKHYKTLVLPLNNRGRYTYFFQLLKLILVLVFSLPFKSLAFTRFADWHTAITAFFCRIYNKKLIIVVGGYDASWFPEYGYGVYNRKTRGKWAKYALRNASMILPNNPSLIENTNEYLPDISRKGGINHFVPDRKGEIQVVHNGYHTDLWIPSEGSKQKDQIVTVAYIGSKRSYDMKGIDDFIEAARNMPDLSFTLIGANTNKIESWAGSIPQNLKLIDALNHDELLPEYQKAKVFCLLSLSEGMPNVLCEAMLCECIPVVSRVNFNADLAGEVGYVVEKRDPSLIMDAIRQAVDSDEELGKMARNRIVDNYPFDRREEELIRVINLL
ncbi:glycosyltransferase family 4 protein [Bacteroidota bacterium]